MLKDKKMSDLRGDREVDCRTYGLRLSDEFREILRRKANINGRSMNSEILSRIRETLVSEGEI